MPGRGATAPLDAEAGECALATLRRDEGAMHAHDATAECARYVNRVGELLARPSDVQIHCVERSIRARGDASMDPVRQG